MDFMDAKMDVTINPEDQDRIDQHWADVRAGLYKSQPHQFKDDSVKARMSYHKEQARQCINGAARHARAATDLAKQEQEQ